MYQIFRDTAVVDIDRYEELLNRRGFVYYDREKLVADIPWLKGDMYQEAEEANRIMAFNSANEYRSCGSDECVYNYLIFTELVPKSYFVSRKAKRGWSLSASKNLRVCLLNRYAEEFLTHYIKKKSLSSKIGLLEQRTDRCHEKIAEAADGTPLYKMKATAFPSPNARFVYKNEAIINIPKTTVSCIGAPNGYTIVWGDFSQSDFRIAYNLFIRSEQDWAILSQVSDLYEGIARLVAERFGEQFDIQEFTKNRKLYKQLILATVYGKRSSLVAEEKQFITRFAKFLDTCPRYKEYYERLRLYKKLNFPIFVDSYFGHREQLDMNLKEEDLIDKGLNTPIQSCSSELIIMQTLHIIDKFREAGLGEEDVSVYFVRHDEPIFLIKTELLEDWAWIFKDHEKIFVDNWSELEMVFHYGQWYSIDDEELTTQAERSYEKNKDKLTIVRNTSNLAESSWVPLENVYTLYVAKQEIGDLSVLTFHDNQNNEIFSMSCQKSDPEVLKAGICSKLEKCASKLKEAGYGRVVIYSKDLAGQHFLCYDDEVMSCVFEVANNLNFRTAWAANRIVVREYCNKKGLECNVVPSAYDLELANGLKKIKFFVG